MGTPPTPSSVCAANIMATTVKCCIPALLVQLLLEWAGSEAGAEVVGRHRVASEFTEVFSEKENKHDSLFSRLKGTSACLHFC